LCTLTLEVQCRLVQQNVDGMEKIRNNRIAERH
jgi:hypothetical protein